MALFNLSNNRLLLQSCLVQDSSPMGSLLCPRNSGCMWQHACFQLKQCNYNSVWVHRSCWNWVKVGEHVLVAGLSTVETVDWHPHGPPAGWKSRKYHFSMFASCIPGHTPWLRAGTNETGSINLNVCNLSDQTLPPWSSADSDSSELR